jgi:hypothetical protein
VKAWFDRIYITGARGSSVAKARIGDFDFDFKNPNKSFQVGMNRDELKVGVLAGTDDCDIFITPNFKKIKLCPTLTIKKALYGEKKNNCSPIVYNLTYKDSICDSKIKTHIDNNDSINAFVKFSIPKYSVKSCIGYCKGLNMSLSILRPAFEIFGDMNMAQRKADISAFIPITPIYSLILEGNVENKVAVLTDERTREEIRKSRVIADLKTMVAFSYKHGRGAVSYSILDEKYNISGRVALNNFIVGASISVNKEFKILPVLGVEYKCDNIRASISADENFINTVALSYKYNEVTNFDLTFKFPEL